MNTSTKHKKLPLVINPFEQLKEFVSDTAKKTPQEVVNTLIPGPEIWKSPTPKPEEMPGGPNFSPVDFNKLQNSYQQQDNPDIDAVRRELMAELPPEQAHVNRHKQFKREEEEYFLKRKQEEAEKERQEELERQQKEQEESEQEKASQQQSTPQGKVRKNILGGGHKKANMDLPPEVRHERKGGAGKH